MVGKGSFRHNSRAFTAKNVDAERTKFNIEYCNEDIKAVYHELFDEALERYNAKQTRADRRIDNYYEKIRTGKQEKLFHEVIFQIGNKDDTNSKSEEGQIASGVLDEFMKGFTERNPHLRVFSAHLHMDEETPHLHIDFVPFTTGSKRGLDTRVSLKKALAQQGFEGGRRSETEWKQWIDSEKKELSRIMEDRDIQWKQLGTKEKHLSVLDFEKKMRSQEVAALEQEIIDKTDAIAVLDEETEIKAAALEDVRSETAELTVKNTELRSELADKEKKLERAEKKHKQIDSALTAVERNVYVYTENKEWQLPSVGTLESASHYRNKKAVPLIQKFIEAIKAITIKYIDIKSRLDDLQAKYSRVTSELAALKSRFSELRSENERLREKEREMTYVKRTYGTEIDIVIEKGRERDRAEARAGLRRPHDHERMSRS